MCSDQPDHKFPTLRDGDDELDRANSDAPSDATDRGFKLISKLVRESANEVLREVRQRHAAVEEDMRRLEERLGAVGTSTPGGTYQARNSPSSVLFTASQVQEPGSRDHEGEESSSAAEGLPAVSNAVPSRHLTAQRVLGPSPALIQRRSPTRTRPSTAQGRLPNGQAKPAADGTRARPHSAMPRSKR